MLTQLILLSVGATICCQQESELTQDFEILRSCPRIIFGEFRSAPWVDAANHFRRMGKEKSLVVLQAYLAQTKDHERIHAICRLLFVNPKGWDRPPFGLPAPQINDEIAKTTFQTFPFAFSEGVPFVLVRGYGGSGKMGSGKQCLEIAKGLDIIKEEYSTTGYEKAASTLVQRESFLRLYRPDDRDQMIKVILGQAKKSTK